MRPQLGLVEHSSAPTDPPGALIFPTGNTARRAINSGLATALPTPSLMRPPADRAQIGAVDRATEATVGSPPNLGASKPSLFVFLSSNRGFLKNAV